MKPPSERGVRNLDVRKNLAVDAEQAARASTNAPELLRVVASSSIADSMGPAALQSFTAKIAHVEVNLGVATTQQMTALLHERLADVALGPFPLADTQGLSIQPLLRWRMATVGQPGHHAGLINIAELANQRWLVDPSGRDPASMVGKLLDRLRVPEERILVFANQDAALSAASRGEGIVPAIDHLLVPDLASQGLVRLPVAGTPIDDMWHVMTLSSERRSAAAARLVRFLSTPDALMEMHRAGSGIPATRFRPPIYVTIWS